MKVVKKTISHQSQMQAEISQPSSQWIIPEMWLGFLGLHWRLMTDYNFLSSGTGFALYLAVLENSVLLMG